MDKVVIEVNQRSRQRVAQALATTPEGWFVTLSPPSRTLDQNSLLWPLLTEVSKQVEWYGQKLTPEQWKDVFTASLKKQHVVPGLDGGFVVCGLSTKVFGKKLFSDLIELIHAFGAERGVRFRAVGYDSDDMRRMPHAAEFCA